MKKTIFGYSQKAALDLGLDLVDLMLITIIKEKEASSTTKKIEDNGKTYVWVRYQTLIEWVPILQLGKRSLAKRLDRLCEIGILEKNFSRGRGSYTYFRFAGNIKGVVTPVTTGCNPDDNGVVTPVTDKEYTVREYTVSKKEKSTTNVVDKKKDGGGDFESVFSETVQKMKTDERVAMMLSGQHITNLEALFQEWKKHIVKNLKQADFVKDGYMNNCRYLSYSIPFLDLSEASEIKLGYGEYLQDNKRWYINRNGTKIEVPMDAPPRKKGTIWYKEERRWGPDI